MMATIKEMFICMVVYFFTSLAVALYGTNELYTTASIISLVPFLIQVKKGEFYWKRELLLLFPCALVAFLDILNCNGLFKTHCSEGGGEWSNFLSFIFVIVVAQITRNLKERKEALGCEILFFYLAILGLVIVVLIVMMISSNQYPTWQLVTSAISLILKDQMREVNRIVNHTENRDIEINGEEGLIYERGIENREINPYGIITLYTCVFRMIFSNSYSFNNWYIGFPFVVSFIILCVITYNTTIIIPQILDISVKFFQILDDKNKKSVPFIGVGVALCTLPVYYYEYWLTVDEMELLQEPLIK